MCSRHPILRSSHSFDSANSVTRCVLFISSPRWHTLRLDIPELTLADQKPMLDLGVQQVVDGLRDLRPAPLLPDQVAIAQDDAPFGQAPARARKAPPVRPSRPRALHAFVMVRNSALRLRSPGVPSLRLACCMASIISTLRSGGKLRREGYAGHRKSEISLLLV